MLHYVWLLLLIAAPVAAGVDPVNPPPPPLVTTQAWFAWYEELLEARLDAVTFPRDQTRYVSSSTGSDANDGATPETAWASVSKARTWINSSNPDLETRELLFRRGDVWRASQLITTDQPGVRFADYGDPEAPAPYFSGFTWTPPMNDAQWSPVNDSTVYFRDAAQAVSWVREDGDVDLDRPLRFAHSLAELIAHPGAWWWSSNEQRLYVHPRDSDDPRSNGKLYEIAHTTGAGFSVRGDRSFIENLRADGFGLNPFVSATQDEAFQSRVRNDDQAVIRNCTSFYGASHVIAHNSGTGSGGVATFINCVAGYTRLNDAGETVFNTYAAGGENQTIFEGCTVARGTLPVVGSDLKRADPVFGHTSAAGATLGLTIVSNLRILEHPFGSPRTGRFNDAPAASVLEDVRVFLVNTIHEGGENVGDRFCPLAYEGSASVNCHFILKPADLGSNAVLQGSRVDGWWINSTVELDLSNQSGSSFGLYGSAASDNRARLWNSAIIARNVPDGLQMRIDRGGAGDSPNSNVINSVMARMGDTGAFVMNLPNASSNVLGNAYWQISAPSADTLSVLLTAPPDVTDSPSPGSLLMSAGATLPGSTPLEFDQRLKDRLAAPLTIGPLEINTVAADLNGDGFVNGADLAILLTLWGEGVSPADLTNDGDVDGADLAVLLTSWSTVKS